MSIATTARPSTSTKTVRSLFTREHKVLVNTSTFAAYLGNRIYLEDQVHPTAATIAWAIAMFQPSGTTGNEAAKPIHEIVALMEEQLDACDPDNDDFLEVATKASEYVFSAVFGKTMKVTGWLPGFTLAEDKQLMRLQGEACPSCTVNPVAYLANTKTGKVMCINRKECGWKE